MTDPIRARIESRIEAEKAKRETAGLHVHWALPDGSRWSAFASNEAERDQWIAAKAKLGWKHIA